MKFLKFLSKSRAEDVLADIFADDPTPPEEDLRPDEDWNFPDRSASAQRKAELLSNPITPRVPKDLPGDRWPRYVVDIDGNQIFEKDFVAWGYWTQDLSSIHLRHVVRKPSRNFSGEYVLRESTRDTRVPRQEYNLWKHGGRR